MPIRPENKDRYPDDWDLRRRFVLMRAQNRCEWCGLHNYAVGQRAPDGRWRPLCGSGPCDAAGQGLSWPSLEPLTYSEAREFADSANEWLEAREPKYIVIVLTTAHIHDDRPEAASLLNLAALCQRCHNRHDAKARNRHRRDRKQVGQLVMEGVA